MTQEPKAVDSKAKFRVLTPKFRVSFPSVFNAKPGMTVGAKPKYSIGMLFPKNEPGLKALAELVTLAAEEKWGKDKAKWPKNLYTPFRDGADKDYDGYGPEIVYATASSVHRPGVVDQNVQPIINQEEFYAGCYARAKIEVFAFEAKDKTTGAVLKRGVTFSLLNVQKHSDGEPFSGRSKPADDFDAIPVPAAGASEFNILGDIEA